MEQELRCNSLRCRGALSQAAVVTSCSHTFCIDCAQSLFTDRLTCPACDSPLSEQDDIIQTVLTPSSAFKSTALSGLSPMTIIDITSRALSFWHYQMGQEATYQSMILKHSQEKASTLEKQVRSVISEATNEIAILRDKLASSERDLDIERRKVRDLLEQQKENMRDYQKLKTQYDKAKSRALLQPTVGASVLRGPAVPTPAHTAQHHSEPFWQAQAQPGQPASRAPPASSNRPMPFRQMPGAAPGGGPRHGIARAGSIQPGNGSEFARGGSVQPPAPARGVFRPFNS